MNYKKDDGLYHGYDSNDSFYNGNSSDDGFYHGYNNDEFQSQDSNPGFSDEYTDRQSVYSGTDPSPFYDSSKASYASSEMNRLMWNYRESHNIGKYEREKPNSFMGAMANSTRIRNEYQAEQLERAFTPPDKIAEGIKDPETMKAVFPGARVATASDAMGKFLMILILSIIVSIATLTPCITTTIQAQRTQANMAYYVPVKGVSKPVTKTIERGMIFRPRREYYAVSYTYEYEGEKYKGSTSLTPSMADELGLAREISFSSYKIPDKEITVYVNPDNPEKSMLCQTEYPAFWRWLIPILPLGLIIYDIKFMLDCYHGRRMVYFSKGMKRYKKI